MKRKSPEKGPAVTPPTDDGGAFTNALDPRRTFAERGHISLVRPLGRIVEERDSSGRVAQIASSDRQNRDRINGTENRRGFASICRRDGQGFDQRNARLKIERQNAKFSLVHRPGRAQLASRLSDCDAVVRFIGSQISSNNGRLPPRYLSLIAKYCDPGKHHDDREETKRFNFHGLIALHRTDISCNVFENSCA